MNTEIEDDIPDEIDFSSGVRGLHQIPGNAKAFVPTSIEKGVWDYFAKRAEEQGVKVSELLTEVLKRYMPPAEARK